MRVSTFQKSSKQSKALALAFLLLCPWSQAENSETPLNKLQSELALLDQEGPTLERLETVAQIYLSLNDLKNAAQYLHRAMDQDNATATTTLKLVSVYLKAGKTNEAIAQLESGAQKYSESTELLIELGNAYAAFEKYSSAIVIYKRAIKTDPENPKTRYYLAHSWFRYGNIEQAEATLSPIMESESPSIESVLLYGKILQETGRSRKGIRQVEKLYKKNPDNIVIRDELVAMLLKSARIEGDAGRLSRAIKSLEQAQKLDPKNTNILLGLALSHNQLGESQIAIEYCKEMIAINQNHLRAYIFLGRLQRMEGQSEEALNTFNKGHQKAINMKDDEHIQLFDQLINPL